MRLYLMGDLITTPCIATDLPYGVLEECDIADMTSDDTNENGIPNECEDEEMRSSPNGGRAPRGGPADSKSIAEEPDSPPSVSTVIQAPNHEAAMEVFYEWSFSQCWGLDCELTTGEQFDAYVNKVIELGLPIVGPTITP